MGWFRKTWITCHHNENCMDNVWQLNRIRRENRNVIDVNVFMVTEPENPSKDFCFMFFSFRLLKKKHVICLPFSIFYFFYI